MALGYIAPPDENKEKAVAMAVRESKYNLARVHLDAARSAEAARLFEELLAETPNEGPASPCPRPNAISGWANWPNVAKWLRADGAHKDLPRVDLLLGRWG